MAISLEKGQRIDLTKGKAGLSKLMVGLGWDPVSSGGGFLERRSAEADQILTVTHQC